MLQHEGHDSHPGPAGTGGTPQCNMHGVGGCMSIPAVNIGASAEFQTARVVTGDADAPHLPPLKNQSSELLRPPKRQH
jgi:hypothetical protein